MATGRGESMSPLPDCPSLWFVLVKPPFGVSTPKVYGNLRLSEISQHPEVQECIQGLEERNKKKILNALGNVLEHSTFELQPQVRRLKESMQRFGCSHVLMSGSGPTVFAAFTNLQQAKLYYQKLKRKYPGAMLVRTVNQAMLEERVKLHGNKSERTKISSN